MHDDPRLTSFMASVRDAYAASTHPAPGEELRALFATGLEVDAPPTAPTSRRRRMFSDVFKAVPGKVAAGLLGATLAYTGLGAAGALPAPLSLASSEDDIEHVVLDDTTTTTLGEDEGDTTTTTTVTDGDADTDTKVAEDVDLALVPVPTSVSEAAHNHAFDEACGNHGKYVSHFARTGTEPECATAARAAADGDGQDTGTELSTADADADADAVADGKGKGKGKGKAQKAKGKANHGKAKKGRP